MPSIHANSSRVTAARVISFLHNHLAPTWKWSHQDNGNEMHWALTMLISQCPRQLNICTGPELHFLQECKDTARRPLKNCPTAIYRAFSPDVTAAILVFQNNKTTTIFVFQTNPARVELFSYVIVFFCSNLQRSWPCEWKRFFYSLCNGYPWHVSGMWVNFCLQVYVHSLF